MKGNLHATDRKQTITQCILKLGNKKAKCDNLLNKEIEQALAMKKKRQALQSQGLSV